MFLSDPQEIDAPAINHPNQYFEESVKLYEEAAKDMAASQTPMQATQVGNGNVLCACHAYIGHSTACARNKILHKVIIHHIATSHTPQPGDNLSQPGGGNTQPGSTPFKPPVSVAAMDLS